MAVGYAKNRCYWKVPEKRSKLMIVDASAYVSAVPTISKSSSFIMASLYENSHVVALDFRNSSRMSNALERISHFAEASTRMSIPTRKDIAALIKKNGTTCTKDGGPCGLAAGHDLKLADVAAFFTKCKKEGVELTKGEQELLSKLTRSGLLLRTRQGSYAISSQKVLIGMSRSHNKSDRRAIFKHEYSHVLYFTNPVFRKKVSSAWSSLKQSQRKFLRGAMVASGIYASGKKWLMETEAQAHAIAPPLSIDGFIALLLKADENCTKPSRACRDFYSYRGNIRGLLFYLNRMYTRISNEWLLELNDPTHSFPNVDKLIKAHNSEPSSIEDLVKELPENFAEIKLDLATLSRQQFHSRIDRIISDNVPRYVTTAPRSIFRDPSPEQLLNDLQRKFDSRRR